MRCASVLKQMPSAPLFSLLGAAKLHFCVGAVPQHMLRLNNLKHSSASSYCNHEQYWPGAVCRAANRSSRGHINTQKQHGWATAPSAGRKRPKALQATIIVQKTSEGDAGPWPVAVSGQWTIQAPPCKKVWPGSVSRCIAMSARIN